MIGELTALAGVKAAILLFALASAVAAARWGAWMGRTLMAVLGAWAGANILFLGFIWINHAPFPLHLDLMEGTVLQHVLRAASGDAVYPAPSPAYVPLAYNPLYYYLCIPAGWMLGFHLLSLRVVAIAGMLGIGVTLFVVVRRRTSSTLQAVLAAGLFAAAYRVMDAYLDTAHADSWFILSALLGTGLLATGRSRRVRAGAILLLLLSFWFKQHGAWFALGGLLFLTRRDGLRSSLPYWLLAFLLGPMLYLWAGPALFGPSFHTFTFTVPSQWTEFRVAALVRYSAFLVFFYLPLAAAGFWLFIRASRGKLLSSDPWLFQLPFALLTGAMGSLDPGSSNNVFIAQGIWLILTGSIGLHTLAEAHPRILSLRPDILGAALAFGLFIYDPGTVLVPDNAAAVYDAFRSELRRLPGTVYAPTLGFLPGEPALMPAAHWVALEDLVRGPRRHTADHPEIMRLLEPAIHPPGQAWIVAHKPLDFYPWLSFLSKSYSLETDWGERFTALRLLPKRWDHGWPRYLYRHSRSSSSPRGADRIGG